MRPNRYALLCAVSAPALLIAQEASAQPVEYVRVCDAYGTGFFYIPGTETCLSMTGYVEPFVYTPGTDISLSALAYEPEVNVLQNPLDTIDMEIDGRGIGFGIRGDIGGTRWSYLIEFQYSEIDGRGVSNGFVPNIGIPGVNQNGGVFFRDNPTTFDSSASVEMQQVGLKVEKSFNLLETVPTDGSWRTTVNALGGLHYAFTDSDLVYASQLHNLNGQTDVRYATDLDEHTLTPYVGIGVGFSRKFNEYDVSLGLAGRLGASFTSYDGTDSLQTSGAVSLDERTHIDENVTEAYASFEAGVAVSRGPVTLGLMGAAEYGAYRDPNIFRADSIDSVNVSTSIDPDPLWTYRVGVVVSYEFDPVTLMSDRRLKTDIVKVGMLTDDIPLYRFRYLWSDDVFVGVMAQDLLTVAPGALVMERSGFYSVDYRVLGTRMMRWDEWQAARAPDEAQARRTSTAAAHVTTSLRL